MNQIEITAAKAADYDGSTEGEFILCARVESKPVGFISIWEEDNFIHNLFVSREYRGMHIGKRLIEAAAEKYGTPLTLKCIRENKQAVDFYLKNGWQIEEENECEEGIYYLMKYCRK